MAEVRKKPGTPTTYAVVDPHRVSRGSDPDGITAYVLARWDATDECWFWWCLFHRSSGCQDVEEVRAYRTAAMLPECPEDGSPV